MKRNLIVLLAALLLTLAGCRMEAEVAETGSTAAPTQAETTAPTEATEAVTIAPTEASAESTQPVTEPEATTVTEETVRVTYDCDGGFFWNSNASPAMSATKTFDVAAGETHTVISGKPTRGGYTFSGWYDAEGNHYQPGDDITPTADMVLKAIWKSK